MGLVTRIAASTTVTFTPATYGLDEATRVYSQGASGYGGSPDVAMTIAMVYACVRNIAEDIGSVPFQVFERTPEGKRVATEHPLYEVLNGQPNDYQSAMEFREMMTAFAMMRRRAVAEKIVDGRGNVIELKPLHPDLVRREVTTGGVARYIYNDPYTRTERTLLSDEVFVLKGPFGLSISEFAQNTIGYALTLRDATRRTFGRGVRTQGALQHPKTLSNKARENLRKALDRYGAGGENEGRPLLLEEGMEWKQISLSMKDAEALATVKDVDRALARYFRMPLHKVGDLERATFSNIEHQGIEYVTDTIRPWADRWEGATRRDLILVQRLRFFAEHNLEGLLRGDIATRYAAYAIGRQWGWLSTNDIRRKENMNSIPGGDDDYLTPLNMTGPNGAVAFAPPKQLAAVAGRLRVMVRDAAGRAIRKENAALAKLSERTGGTGQEWEAGVNTFYDEYEGFLTALHIMPEEVAAEYCAERRRSALAKNVTPDETADISQLTTLALERAELLRLPAEAAA